MKHILILLFALFVSTALCAQTMERQVIGAGGGFAQTTAGSLHWTAGEMAISPRTTLDIYWGEGFQQVWVAPTVSTDGPDAAPAIALTVYPNPAADYLRVECDAPLQAQLFDLSGRPVSGLVAVNGMAEFNLGNLPAGLYLLRAFDEQGRMAGVAKVQHIR